MTYSGYELPQLITGKLVKRYKRFLADIELENKEIITAHCPNSGSMKGCAMPGSPVWISTSDNPKRKLKYTWELLQTKDSMIGINTQVPNKLIKAAIENNQISEFTEFTKIRAEVKTSEHTRLDLLLENEVQKTCYVEIKNCTLVEDGVAMFPDAVTTRGQKHLDELVRLRKEGHRAVIFYLIQRMDARVFTPAAMIDKDYAQKLKNAVKNGVEIVTRDTFIDPGINPGIIQVRRSVPVRLET
ncbi:MAG: sugar fermentation stimulation protein SfsA [Desulfobacteraceae bacterium 4572_89]|nr:MAG: sugar fermentation stimulation protein SfsA [Desulfobacteraceae bacterium 4572_89]